MGWQVAVRIEEDCFVGDTVVLPGPACVRENGQVRSGFKAELYCSLCARPKCVFRPTMSPLEYCEYQYARWCSEIPLWLIQWAERERIPLEYQPVPTREEAKEQIVVLLEREPQTLPEIGRQVNLDSNKLWRVCNALREAGVLLSTRVGKTLEWRVAANV